METLRLRWSVGWALVYAAVAAAAALGIDKGHNLLGGLAFALHRLPRQFFLSLGGPDPAEVSVLNASLVGACVFVLALGFLFLSGSRRASETAGPPIPWASVVIGLVLVYEILYLLFGPMPRHVFGDLRFRLFLPWHLVALALTFLYVIWSRKGQLADWKRRSYWLTVFVLALCVLFPMTDAL